MVPKGYGWNTGLMSLFQSDSVPFRSLWRKADAAGKGALILSLWFGAGLLPRAPGTFGTLFAVPLVFVMNFFGAFYGGLFLILLICTAVGASGRAELLMGEHDPPRVVVDEAAGFWVAMYLLPLSWATLLSGFIFFRLFDITKPFPIKRLEKIGGGPGIVLDDLMAGI
ncbi:MAG: phosphatidylglycerophosphatase A, partial [Pseudomonadota bacterium]